MNEIELWAARDKSGTLYLYRNKPTKDMFEWYSLGFSLALASASFPEIQWSDKEPTRVKVTIEELYGKDKGNTAKCANANMEID